MVLYMKDNLKMIISKDMEKNISLMEIYMKENLRMVLMMDLVYFILL